MFRVTYKKDINNTCEAWGWGNSYAQAKELAKENMKGNKCAPAFDELQTLEVHFDLVLDGQNFNELEADWVINFTKKFELRSRTDALTVIDYNGMPFELMADYFGGDGVDLETLNKIFDYYVTLQIEAAEEYIENVDGED